MSNTKWNFCFAGGFFGCGVDWQSNRCRLHCCHGSKWLVPLLGSKTGRRHVDRTGPTIYLYLYRPVVVGGGGGPGFRKMKKKRKNAIIIMSFNCMCHFFLVYTWCHFFQAIFSCDNFSGAIFSYTHCMHARRKTVMSPPPTLIPGRY